MTELENARIQASNACISFYESCFMEELFLAPPEIMRLYELGKKIKALVDLPRRVPVQQNLITASQLIGGAVYNPFDGRPIRASGLKPGDKFILEYNGMKYKHCGYVSVHSGRRVKVKAIGHQTSPTISENLTGFSVAPNALVTKLRS